jgi:putative ABC transport system permease protein
VVAFRVAPAPARYPEPRDLGVFYDELTAELEALPSARRVGLANFAPFTSGDWGHDFRVVGEAVSDPEVGAHPANVRITGYGYYDALGIPLVRGRLLDRNDDASGAPVVLLNETAAAEAFPGEEVLGRLVEFEGVTRQIVGVVGDVRHHSLAEAPSPEIHLPVDQMPPAAAWVVVAGRDARPPSISDLRAAVARVDPALALTSFASYDDRLADAVAAERFRAFLVAGLGALAVIIALVGIYGTVSNMVTRRWREIGIRLALGEGRAGVIRCVLGRAGGLVGIGIAAGALVSAGLAGRMAGLLFETDPYDPTIYLAVALLVWLVSLLAGFGPALTASRLDLTEVIRTD